jgi:hypothetical protein
MFGGLKWPYFYFESSQINKSLRNNEKVLDLDFT